LLTERKRGESGYSLVEVMVSIIILSLAILPMVGMFDMGLKTATRGSNYDKSRALANLKLEEAKSLPFASLQNDFPVAGSTPDATTGYYDSGFIPASAPFTNFQYRIEKQYMRQFSKAPVSGSPPEEFEPCDPDPTSTDPTIACSPGTDLMRITVTVQWADGNEYHTLGLVSA
jgi:prepilin-type N-terminal cleavage/methylation domain-containing protein